MGAASVRGTSRGKNFRNGDEDSFLFFVPRDVSFFGGGGGWSSRGTFTRPRKVEALVYAFLCDLAKARHCILTRTLHRSESFSSWPSCDPSHLGKACCCSLAKCTEAAGRNRRSRITVQVDAYLRDRAESRRCILLGVLRQNPIPLES